MSSTKSTSKLSNHNEKKSFVLLTPSFEKRSRLQTSEQSSTGPLPKVCLSSSRPGTAIDTSDMDVVIVNIDCQGLLHEVIHTLRTIRNALASDLPGVKHIFLIETATIPVIKLVSLAPDLCRRCSWTSARRS